MDWVEVQSEPGQGSTFHVYLPRIEASLTAAKTEEVIARVKGTETVLVVEDQEDLRKLVTTVLQSCGLRVLDAANGRAALLLAADFPGAIDLLLTDVIMPDMTGKQVADELSKLRPAMKILYTSGYSGEVIAQRGVLAEGVHYLPKPFTVESLEMKVREVLGPSSKCA